jgi:hypothetical protein
MNREHAAESNSVQFTFSHAPLLSIAPQRVSRRRGGPDTTAIELAVMGARMRACPIATPTAFHTPTPQTIQSPAQNRSLARYTCNVQVYGPDPVATPPPGHGTHAQPATPPVKASSQAWVAIRWVRAFEGKVESPLPLWHGTRTDADPSGEAARPSSLRACSHWSLKRGEGRGALSLN